MNTLEKDSGPVFTDPRTGKPLPVRAFLGLLLLLFPCFVFAFQAGYYKVRMNNVDYGPFADPQQTCNAIASALSVMPYSAQPATSPGVTGDGLNFDCFSTLYAGSGSGSTVINRLYVSALWPGAGYTNTFTANSTAPTPTTAGITCTTPAAYGVTTCNTSSAPAPTPTPIEPPPDPTPTPTPTPPPSGSTCNVTLDTTALNTQLSGIKASLDSNPFFSVPASTEFATAWSAGFMLPMILGMVSWAVATLTNFFKGD